MITPDIANSRVEVSELPLEETIKDVLREFVMRLKESEGDNLLRVVLFGSMARGDYDDESDTDVFVLLRDGDSLGELGSRISAIAYNVDADVCNCYTYTSPFVKTTEELKKQYNGKYDFIPVFKAISEEGIVLYDAQK